MKGRERDVKEPKKWEEKRTVHHHLCETVDGVDHYDGCGSAKGD